MSRLALYPPFSGLKPAAPGAAQPYPEQQFAKRCVDHGLDEPPFIGAWEKPLPGLAKIIEWLSEAAKNCPTPHTGNSLFRAESSQVFILRTHRSACDLNHRVMELGSVCSLRATRGPRMHFEQSYYMEYYVYLNSCFSGMGSISSLQSLS
jgi:hypothetical protein